MRGRYGLPIYLSYAVVCLLVLVFLASQMGGQIHLTQPYTVRAEFVSASDLVQGDDVTMAGIRVGTVQAVAPTQNGASATLVINKPFNPLFRDARAIIETKNLLGEAYVEVDRGTSSTGSMPINGTIPQDHTLTPVEISQVLNALDPTVTDQLDVLINTLGEATAGQGANLNASAGDVQAISANLAVLSQTLANNSADLDTVIADLDKIMQTLAAWHAQFRSLVTEWDNVMANLASREQALTGTVTEDDQVMSIFDQAMAGTSPQALHDALAEAPTTLANANHYLIDATTVFDTLLKDTPANAQLFYEMETVMAGQASDGSGQYEWRVYCSSNASPPSDTTKPAATPEPSGSPEPATCFQP